MRMFEVTKKPEGPLSPEKARLQSLQNQVERSREAVKAERARQKLQAAQRQLAKL